MRIERLSPKSDSLKIKDNLHKSAMDRRSFLLRMAAVSAAAALPVTMCTPEQKAKITTQRNSALLSEKEWQILIEVQDILFPSESDSPGAREINAAGFVQWIIGDDRVDPDERKFLKNGLSRVDEEAVERWEKPFLELKNDEREKLLRHIETHSWGESWLSVMLLRIFEALLSDPLYGGNVDGAGWAWLEHNPGEPRPDKDKIYGNRKL